MADGEDEVVGPPFDDDGEEAVEGEDELDGEEEGEEEDIESEAEEVDPFELLNESDEEDEEQRAMYKEYLQVIDAIDAQNKVVQDLKAQTAALRDKRCKTYRDKEDIKRLRICQRQEETHLRVLMNQAVALQNFGSRRCYRDVELEVTEDEQYNFLTGTSNPLPLPASRSDECCVNKGMCCTDSDSDSDP
ncbi:hypothetical protein KR018_001774 [Drosophila ironensis]|nr:hypothetical protein KR018_001774 [Drosophila ironensis]